MEQSLKIASKGEMLGRLLNRADQLQKAKRILFSQHGLTVHNLRELFNDHKKDYGVNMRINRRLARLNAWMQHCTSNKTLC